MKTVKTDVIFCSDAVMKSSCFHKLEMPLFWISHQKLFVGNFSEFLQKLRKKIDTICRLSFLSSFSSLSVTFCKYLIEKRKTTSLSGKQIAKRVREKN